MLAESHLFPVDGCQNQKAKTPFRSLSKTSSVELKKTFAGAFNDSLLPPFLHLSQECVWEGGYCDWQVLTCTETHLRENPLSQSYPSFYPSHFIVSCVFLAFSWDPVAFIRSRTSLYYNIFSFLSWQPRLFICFCAPAIPFSLWMVWWAVKQLFRRILLHLYFDNTLAGVLCL